MQIKVNLERKFVRINNFLDKKRNSRTILKETNAPTALEAYGIFISKIALALFLLIRL